PRIEVAELRLGRGDADVARERDAHPGADRGPVHRCDRRLRVAVEVPRTDLSGPRGAVQVSEGGLAPVRLQAVEIVSEEYLLYVLAGVEAAPGARDDQDAHVVVVHRFVRDGLLLDLHRIVVRVHHFRTVEDEDSDPVLLRVFNGAVGHEGLSRWAVSAPLEDRSAL